MKTITIREAREDLDRVLEEAAASTTPIRITGPRSAGVLVSEAHWRSPHETLYLLSVSGLRESIHDAARTSVEKCSDSCFE